MMTTTTSVQRRLPLLLMLLLLLVCLLFGLSAAHELPAATTDHSSSHQSSALVVLLQQLFQQQTSTIDKLRTELSDYKKQQKSVNDQMQTDIGNIKKQVDSPSVAFTARISHSRDNLALAPKQIVDFDDVITNAGNAYNPHNGIFTAPSSGTYVFFLNVMAVTGQASAYLHIIKNGSILDGVWAEGSENHAQGSTQVTTELTAGDQVWVRQGGGNSVRGSWWTIFSGFKLH